MTILGIMFGLFVAGLVIGGGSPLWVAALIGGSFVVSGALMDSLPR